MRRQEARKPPTGGGGGREPRHVVEIISEHCRRQATPEVWAEIDALRERVSDLEEFIEALIAVQTGDSGTQA